MYDPLYFYLEIWSWTFWRCLQVVQNDFFLDISHLSIIFNIFTNFYENPSMITTFKKIILCCYLKIWSWTSWSCLQAVKNYFFLDISHLNIIVSIFTNFYENPITIRNFVWPFVFVPGNLELDVLELPPSCLKWFFSWYLTPKHYF